MNNVVKFPYSASRRVYSMQPRRSKNGTPEERAAKATAALPPPAHIVALGPQEPLGDRRKLRGNPLRNEVAPISFAVTVVGKMHTADLRQEPIDLDVAASEAWLDTLRAGTASAKFAACELDKAIARLQQLEKPETSELPGQLAKSEISHSSLNLAVTDLGQSVLNQIADGDR